MRGRLCGVRVLFGKADLVDLADFVDFVDLGVSGGAGGGKVRWGAFPKSSLGEERPPPKRAPRGGVRRAPGEFPESSM